MIRLAFFRGKGLISRLIRLQTRGRYSHVGVLTEEGYVIEAWHIGGVCFNAHLGMVHAENTPVDIYRVPGLTRGHNAEILQWLKQQCGKGYDYRSVARFISRREQSAEDRDRWFCSELVMAAFNHAAFPLLTCPAWKVSPEVLSWSPRLQFEYSTFTEKPEPHSFDLEAQPA